MESKSELQHKEFGQAIKIIILGDSCSEKKSFLDKWDDTPFNEYYKSTIITDFKIKTIENNGHLFQIILWDIPINSHNNNYFNKILLKDSQGLICIIDATRPESIEDAVKWKSEIDNSIHFVDGGPLPCIIIENKIDLVIENETKNDDYFREHAKTHKFDNGFRVSSRKGINVNESMDYLIKLIIQKIEDSVGWDKKYFLKTNKNIAIVKKKDNKNENNKCFK